MFCSNCGKELPDNIAYCTNCGVKLQNTNQANANGRVPWTQQYNPVPPAQPVQIQPAMNWYKFLIYFSLFAGAVINLVSGIFSFVGGSYMIFGLDPETVYSIYDGLKILDIGYGIVYLAFIPFALYVRSALAGFKKDAPNMFYIYNIAGVIVSASYTLFSSIVMDVDISQTIGQLIGSIGGNVLFIALNVIYFNKRKQLFVN